MSDHPEIRKGEIGYNQTAPGAQAPSGKLSDYTHALRRCHRCSDEATLLHRRTKEALCSSCFTLDTSLKLLFVKDGNLFT